MHKVLITTINDVFTQGAIKKLGNERIQKYNKIKNILKPLYNAQCTFIKTLEFRNPIFNEIGPRYFVSVYAVL